MIEHGMAGDFSWERAVDRYYEVYEQAFEARTGSLNAQNA
jgi:glycogen synthase